MNGVLVVDKPSACTSHDVVQRVRRAIRQRSVGHAGTLDPLATGVLVVAIGEATKLVSHLQSDDKRYAVTIALGAETDSLDADGAVTDTAKVPAFDAAFDNTTGGGDMSSPLGITAMGRTAVDGETWTVVGN